MNAHVQVRSIAVESNLAAPYDLDSEGQPIVRTDAEKLVILKAEMESAIAEGGAFSDEEVGAFIEAHLANLPDLRD